MDGMDRRDGWLLLAGDVVLILTLLAIGLLSHDTDPLTNPAYLGRVAAPFLLGWFVATLLAGVYRPAAIESWWSGARLGALAWLAAANVGLVIRSAPATHGGVEWPFGLVVTVGGLLLVLAWRGAFTLGQLG